MRLVKFKVQNYKRIDETDWIDVDDVTALVGGNESGKTSVLQALWKLKPGHENIVLNAQVEFPRHRYADAYLHGGRFPVVTALFAIDEALREQLLALDSAFAACEYVQCTSYYDHDPTVEFVPMPDLNPVSANDAQPVLQALAKAVKQAEPPLPEPPPGASPEEAASLEAQALEAVAAYREAVAGLVDRTLSGLKGTDTEGVAQELISFRQQLSGLSPEAWQRETWLEVESDLDRLVNRPDVESRLQEAVNLAWEAVPVFIYFDDYNLLESEIYIPEAIQRIAAGSTDPRVRSQWALFERAGFPIKEIAGLAYRPDPDKPLSEETMQGLFKQIRERAIIASSAARTITDEFANWWHQHRHEIDFRVDGETFQIWVLDDRYPVPVEFESRSRGFRWFFSFYLIFSVERGHAHKNAVLLLDEPGLHLYPPAQEELLRLFDELSANNQVAYTTHSSFMVDTRRLERVRVVEEMDDGLVRIMPDAGSLNGDLVFPVMAALEHQLVRTFGSTRRLVILESEAAYVLLDSMHHTLLERGRPGLPEGTQLSFAGGAASMKALLALLAGRGPEILAVLDADTHSRAALADLQAQGFADLPGVLLTTCDEFSQGLLETEMMLPIASHVAAVQATHDADLTGLTLADGEALSTAIERMLRAQGVWFDPAKAMRWLVAQWNNGDRLPKGLLDAAEAFLTAVG